MAQILVRNLSQNIVRKLKRHAKASGRSLEAQARYLLEREAEMMTMEDARAAADELCARIAERRRPSTDSTHLIREDRER